MTESEQIASLLALMEQQIVRLDRLERLVLTFRQAHIIMLAGSEDYLGMERSLKPRHLSK